MSRRRNKAAPKPAEDALDQARRELGEWRNWARENLGLPGGIRQPEDINPIDDPDDAELRARLNDPAWTPHLEVASTPEVQAAIAALDSAPIISDGDPEPTAALFGLYVEPGHGWVTVRCDLPESVVRRYATMTREPEIRGIAVARVVADIERHANGGGR